MFEVRLTYVKLHTHSFLCKIKKALCWVKELYYKAGLSYSLQNLLLSKELVTSVR